MKILAIILLAIGAAQAQNKTYDYTPLIIQNSNECSTWSAQKIDDKCVMTITFYNLSPSVSCVLQKRTEKDITQVVLCSWDAPKTENVSRWKRFWRRMVGKE